MVQPVVDGDGRVIAMLSIRDIPLVNQLMHLQWTTWTVGELREPQATNVSSAQLQKHADAPRTSTSWSLK